MKEEIYEHAGRSCHKEHIYLNGMSFSISIKGWKSLKCL